MGKMLIILAAIFSSLLVGCASDEVTVSKCSSYEKGICVNKEIIKDIPCDKSVTVKGHQYCIESK